jgi:hypothetical protein
MKHNINPLIHPKLLNSTFSSNLLEDGRHGAGMRKGIRNGTLNGIMKGTMKVDYNKNSTNTNIKPFIYNICIPVIIIIIICFILKDRRNLKMTNDGGYIETNQISELYNMQLSDEELAYRNIR